MVTFWRMRFVSLVMSVAAMATATGQRPPRDPLPPRDRSVPRTGTASISGQVVLSSGEPVSDAEVAISGARGRTTTSTGADGRFEFPALPSGAYYLFANRQDLLSVRYGERIYGRGGRTIPLADGERREFRLTLPRRSRIAGRVTDASGRPLAKAAVRLVRLMPPALYGYPAAFQWGSATTDGAGRYLFASVQPADYAICASASETLPLDPGIGYAVGCIPPAADSPQKITIAPEETRSGIDITLGTVRVRSVEGALHVPDGVPTPDLVLLKNMDEIYDDPSLAARPMDGRFRFGNVPPGHYVLRAQSGSVQDSAGGLREVLVEGTDLTDIVLTMARGSIVAGRLEFSGALAPSASARQPRLLLNPSVRGSRSLRWGSYQATADTTGAFVFPSVLPGVYRLNADYLQPQNWYMETVGDPDRSDHLIDVRAGQNVTGVILKMTDYRAEVTGTIVTERGFPAPEFMIVVYPSNPKDWDSPSAFGRPHPDGTFDFRLKRPGTYRLGFIEDYDPAVRIGPDLLRDVDRTAVTVSVVAGRKNTVRFVVPADR